MAQSVWVITAQGQAFKIVDMTDKPASAASACGPLPDAHFAPSGVGAVIEAARVAGTRGRRITSVAALGQEIVLIVE